MKGFITLHRHRYSDMYYHNSDQILINVSKINTVYRLKYQTGTSLEYDYITTIFIDNTEYHVEEDYYTVVDMIEEALRNDSLEGDNEILIEQRS